MHILVLFKGFETQRKSENTHVGAGLAAGLIYRHGPFPPADHFLGFWRSWREAPGQAHVSRVAQRSEVKPR